MPKTIKPETTPPYVAADVNGEDHTDLPTADARFDALPLGDSTLQVCRFQRPQGYLSPANDDRDHDDEPSQGGLPCPRAVWDELLEELTSVPATDDTVTPSTASASDDPHVVAILKQELQRDETASTAPEIAPDPHSLTAVLTRLRQTLNGGES